MLPPSEHLQYSLADLDSIFTEPPADLDMLAPDDFLKDVMLEPGLDPDPDLLHVHDMFDPDDAPRGDFIDPDEFLIHNYLRNPNAADDEQQENTH